MQFESRIDIVSFYGAFIEDSDLKLILESLIKKLILEYQYDVDETHVYLQRKHRGFSIALITQALRSGFLYELTAPSKVLWGCDIEGRFLILALWLYDRNRKPAFKWTQESIAQVEFIHVKTAFWEGDAK